MAWLLLVAVGGCCAVAVWLVLGAVSVQGTSAVVDSGEATLVPAGTPRGTSRQVVLQGARLYQRVCSQAALRAGQRWVRLTARLARWRAQQQARAAQGRLAQQLVRERCEAELPSLLDLVCLGLQAGLSFDAALELYCAKRKTALAERLAQALYAWRMGLCTRQEALRRLAQQLEAPSFAGFVDAVEEALLFGTPLAHTLERQADLLREEERLKTEERIEKIPVKMLIPLGCLVVPGMLLAILGPLLSNAFAVM